MANAPIKIARQERTPASAKRTRAQHPGPGKNSRRIRGCDERGVPRDPDIRSVYLAERRGEGHVCE